MNRQLVDIPIGDVHVKESPRRDDGDLATLEGSIRRVGLLSPILIDKNNVLISGHRRIKACRNLGMETVPAFRLEVEARSLTALAIQSDENLCRLPLSPAEFDALIRTKREMLGEKAPRKTSELMDAFRKLLVRERGEGDSEQ